MPIQYEKRHGILDFWISFFKLDVFGLPIKKENPQKLEISFDH